MPVELDDLTVQTQEAIEMYQLLPEIYAGMGGFAGKDNSSLPTLLRLYQVPEDDWLIYYSLIFTINNEQIKIANEQARVQDTRGNNVKENST